MQIPNAPHKGESYSAHLPDIAGVASVNEPHPRLPGRQ